MTNNKLQSISFSSHNNVDGKGLIHALKAWMELFFQPKAEKQESAAKQNYSEFYPLAANFCRCIAP